MFICYSLLCHNFRFEFMMSCWESKDTLRPSFSEIVTYLSSHLEYTSDYLDLTGVNNHTPTIRGRTGSVEDFSWSMPSSLQRTPAANNDYYVASK